MWFQSSSDALYRCNDLFAERLVSVVLPPALLVVPRMPFALFVEHPATLLVVVN